MSRAAKRARFVGGPLHGTVKIRECAPWPGYLAEDGSRARAVRVGRKRHYRHVVTKDGHAYVYIGLPG